MEDNLAELATRNQEEVHPSETQLLATDEAHETRVPAEIHLPGTTMDAILSVEIPLQLPGTPEELHGHGRLRAWTLPAHSNL